jgi:hypothetical protein
LKSNDLLTDDEQKFIYQDISELIKELPWYTKMIGQSTTDLAHKMDIAINGEGFRKKK